MKHYTASALLLLSLLTTRFVNAQDFMNGDLDGAITFFTLPAYWQSVPYDDPCCEALYSFSATPDITGLTGPDTVNGIMGNPFSGTSFISGVYGGATGPTYQEGIMQTVTGLIPGNYYMIHFRQAVVKQTNCLDQSGCWKVYCDDFMLSITAPTFSAEPFNSTSFIWESRGVLLRATDTSHVIKFLPADDDTNCISSFSDTTGAIRMGIDSIRLSDSAQGPVFVSGCALQLSAFPNPAGTSLRLLLGENCRGAMITVFDLKGASVMDPQPAENVEVTLNISTLAAGVYVVRVEAANEVGVVKIVKE